MDDDVNKFSLNDDYFVIAIDSTGVKVTNRGEWIRHKWNVKRGYLKIHVAVDIKKKRILSLHATMYESMLESKRRIITLETRL